VWTHCPQPAPQRFLRFESGRNASVHAGAENRAEFTFNPLQPFVNAKYGISTDICSV
jgi:hypothetical protein